MKRSLLPILLIASLFLIPAGCSQDINQNQKVKIIEEKDPIVKIIEERDSIVIIDRKSEKQH